MAKIDKRIFRYIEYELYNYDQTRDEYLRCREKILHGTPVSDGVRVQTGPSDVTATKVLQLTSAYLAHAERVLGAIEGALKELTELHRGVFDKKYMQGEPWQMIAVELSISDRTFFRLRRDIVVKVGQKLGQIELG